MWGHLRKFHAPYCKFTCAIVYCVILSSVIFYRRSSIQYFSDHLFWLDNGLTLTVGDKECNYTSEIAAVTKPVTMFTIKHPSLQPYPGNNLCPYRSTITFEPFFGRIALAIPVYRLAMSVRLSVHLSVRQYFG